MKAVVLAAGEGVRMRPITETRPKHMIPIAGRPVIEYLLQALKGAGVREILMVVGYRHDLIEGYFGDGSEWGLDLSYARQGMVGGTAHAIGLAEEYVGKEPFVTVYGDLLISPATVESALEAHRRGGLATMTVVPVEEAERYGVVDVRDGYVVDIVEKPRRGAAPSNLANAGVYVFTEEVFEEIRRTQLSKREELEITDTLRLLIGRGERVFPVRISPEEWMDVGRPWDLLEANRRILEEADLEVEGDVEEGARLIGPVGVAEGVRIRSGAYIVGPVFIGDGSDVGPNCYVRPHTSVGRHVRIGNACEIKNSLILDGAHIAHLSYIGDSIIGAHCNLGAGTITGNLRLDERPVRVMVKGELVDSGLRKLGVIMGDNVKTAINVNTMPGVKIGADAWIGPNTTIYRDIPSGGFVLQKQELEHREVP